jgi:hypothetical protein
VCPTIVQDLAATLKALSEHKAPASAVEAVQSVLHAALGAAVRQLASHLCSSPPGLMARETWELSLTHTGSELVTHLPEQLQVRRAFTGSGSACSYDLRPVQIWLGWLVVSLWGWFVKLVKVSLIVDVVFLQSLVCTKAGGGGAGAL